MICSCRCSCMVVMTSNSYHWSPGSNPRGVKLSLVAMKLACRNDEGGTSQVSWLLQNGTSWGCGSSEAGVCWQTVEDRLWFFSNAYVWIVYGGGDRLWELNGLPRKHSVKNQWGKDRQSLKAWFCRRRGGEGWRGEAETESLILWLVVLEFLAGGWWWREAQSFIQGWLETHILYTRVWERQHWEWVRPSDWVREPHCVVKREWKFVFILFDDFFLFLLIFFFFHFLLYFLCWICSESPSDGDFFRSLLLAW